MPDWLVGLFAQVRQSSPILTFATAFGTAALLFLPANVLEQISMDEFASHHREAIGLAFLVALCLFLSQSGHSALEWGRSIWTEHHEKERVKDEARVRAQREEAKDREREEQLHALTIDEKAYLLLYIRGGRTSVRIPLQDGVAGELRQKGILFLGSKMGTAIDGWDHNLSPWARKYLKANPSLLDGASQNVEFRSPYSSYLT